MHNTARSCNPGRCGGKKKKEKKTTSGFSVEGILTSASMVPHRGISLSDLAAAEVSIEELGQWADLSFSRRHVYQLLEDSTHTRTHARAERDRERESRHENKRERNGYSTWKVWSHGLLTFKLSAMLRSEAERMKSGYLPLITFIFYPPCKYEEHLRLTGQPKRV